MSIKSLYVIGSLRNKNIPTIEKQLRAELGIEIFTDWFCAGRKADDSWMEHEKHRGKSYREALDSYAAKHVFSFDKTHLDRVDGAVLVAPAGRSAHLELGYVIGTGKPGFILLPSEPKRWDVMYQFANKICLTVEELITEIRSRA